MKERPKQQECGECACCDRWAWEYNLACDISQRRRKRNRELLDFIMDISPAWLPRAFRTRRLSIFKSEPKGKVFEKTDL